MSVPTIFKGFLGQSLTYSKDNDVNRWHNTPVLRKETVAAHSFDILKKSLALSKFLELCGFANDFTAICEMTMVHDIEERTGGTGDIPSDFKAKMSPVMKEEYEEIALKTACKMIADDFPSLLSELLQRRRDEYEKQETLEAQIVKVADCLSSLSFLERELNALHNDSILQEFNKNRRKLLALSEKYPWLEQIWVTIFGDYLTHQYDDEIPKSMREPGWQLISGPVEGQPDYEDAMPKA